MDMFSMGTRVTESTKLYVYYFSVLLWEPTEEGLFHIDWRSESLVWLLTRYLDPGCSYLVFWGIKMALESVSIPT